MGFLTETETQADAAPSDLSGVSPAGKRNLSTAVYLAGVQFPTLECLRLCNGTVKADRFLPLKSAYSALKTLSFESCNLGPDFLWTVRPDGRKTVLPRLKELRFVSTPGPRWIFLENFLDQRRLLRMPLTYLEIRDCELQGQPKPDRLQSIAKKLHMKIIGQDGQGKDARRFESGVLPSWSDEDLRVFRKVYGDRLVPFT